jgi:ABC-type transport system involved in cytochrome c biogenesis permease subunit
MNFLLKITFVDILTLFIAQWGKKNVTPISAIYANLFYQGTKILVFGKVKNKISALGKSGYWLEDETGKES